MTNPFLQHTFEIIGGLKLERHEGLLQGEEEWFERYESRKFEAGLTALEFANAIAKDLNVTGQEALALIESAQQGGTSVDMLMKYPQEMRSVLKVKELDVSFVPSVATLVIQSRCSSDWLLAQLDNLAEAFGVKVLTLDEMESKLLELSAIPVENLSSVQIERMDELQEALSAQSIWVRSFTKRLSRQTVLELATFVGGERRGWVSLPEPIAEGETDLGDLSPNTEPSSTEGTVLTGTNVITPSNKRESPTTSSGVKTGRVALPA